jgi:NarL family two-component system sensor histidine kinase LiaS
LEQVNLVEVLQTRLETVERRAGEEFHFEVQESLVLPKAWEGEFYCIAMEALNNALKHARAGQVTVRLWDEGNWVELVIEDNGRGFDPHRRRPGGMGLQNISERVERLQGVLKIDSTPGKGTRVQVRLPRLASEVIASGELHEP